jgi:NADPH-dependent curcumin reductase CurA
MVGGTGSRVANLRHPDFGAGDLILAYSGWQDYAVSDDVGLHLLDTAMPRTLLAFVVLGMTGFRGYMGLLEIGQPQAGETCCNGGVGSVVGQLAKRQGCHVVGIAGGVDKCRYVVEPWGWTPGSIIAGSVPAAVGRHLPPGHRRLFRERGRCSLRRRPALAQSARPHLAVRADCPLFIGLLEGKKFGKLVIRVADD